MTEEKITLSREARMRDFFEREANRNERIYNFTPSDKPGQTYWSLHAERAWTMFKLGAEFADID